MIERCDTIFNTLDYIIKIKNNSIESSANKINFVSKKKILIKSRNIIYI